MTFPLIQSDWSDAAWAAIGIFAGFALAWSVLRRSND